MTYRLKLLVVTILSTLLLTVGMHVGTVKALPALSFYFNADSGFEDSLILSDDDIPFLLIDTDSYTVSDDVTSVEIILKNPANQIVPNQSDIGGYLYEFTEVGLFTLEVHLTNATDSTMLPYTISVTKEFDTSTLGTPLEIDKITDTKLSSALLSVFQKLYKEQYGSTCNITKPYSDMFMSVEISTLNLSGKGITSLNGMQYLNFNNLTTLIVSNNELSTAKSEFLDDEYSTLTTIDLSNNQLTEVSLINLRNATNINLANNLIETIDLTHINVGSNECNVNLAHNEIKSTEDVKLPMAENKYSKLNINLLSNYVGLPHDEWKNNSRLNPLLGLQFKPLDLDYSVELGGSENDTKTILKILHTDTVSYTKTNIANLKLVIYKITKDVDNADVETVYKTIDESTMTNKQETFELPCGEYKYKYFIGEEEAYSNTNERRIYRSEKFITIPQSPTFYFTHNGKKYESMSKVTGVLTVKFELYETDEDLKIYYRVDSGEWKEGTKVDIQGGTHTVFVKAVSSNGYESEEQLVYVQTSLNPYVPDFVLLLFIIFLLIMMVFVIVPLLGKWINSDKK